MNKEQNLEARARHVSDILTRLYYDASAPSSYGGKEKLWRYAKRYHIKRHELDTWLRAQRGYTMLKEKSKRKKTFKPTYATSVDGQWQADLLDMHQYAKWNKKVKFLLTVVDVLSRYAYVVPLKGKTGSEVSKAFAETVRRNEGEAPDNLQTDKGKEFYNTNFKHLLSRKEIHHFTTEGDNKATLVERFNRTIKQRILAYMLSNRTREYLEKLNDLVEGYNASKHSSHGRAPEDVDVWNEGEVRDVLYGTKLHAWWERKKKENNEKKKKNSTLPIGAHVRLLQLKANPFERSYYGRWTEEIFKIAGENVQGLGKKKRYKVVELDDSPIEGVFYADELQQVQAPMLYDIERIVRKRKNKQTGLQELLVKWKGYGIKYNSWIPDTNIIR